MKNFLRLLLVLLPLQWISVAAAGYCQHETGMAAKHVGHHAHKHQDTGNGTAEKSSNPASKVHGDCGMCHLNCGGLLRSYEVSSFDHGRMRLSPRDLTHFLFDVTSRPERPKWETLV